MDTARRPTAPQLCTGPSLRDAVLDQLAREGYLTDGLRFGVILRGALGQPDRELGKIIGRRYLRPSAFKLDGHTVKVIHFVAKDRTLAEVTLLRYVKLAQLLDAMGWRLKIFRCDPRNGVVYSAASGRSR